MTGEPAAEVGRGRQPRKAVGKREKTRGARAGRWISSRSEIPVHSRARRLLDWIHPRGARKVPAFIDKVYQRKNLERAWERVKAKRGSGGVEGQSREGFAAQLEQQVDRWPSELKEEVSRPPPVRQVQNPQAGKPGEFRTLGIPTIYDRVCQPALLHRLEPIWEPVCEDAHFGYRRGRSTKHARPKVWKRITSGREWIVDADCKDFFGSVDPAKLLTLVSQRIADGRGLRRREAMLQAGSYGKGRLFPTERGTPQGGVKTQQLIAERNPGLRGWGIPPSEPTSESSSTGSTAGWCGAFGRIEASVGATLAGDSCRKPSCTASRRC